MFGNIVSRIRGWFGAGNVASGIASGAAGHSLSDLIWRTIEKSKDIKSGLVAAGELIDKFDPGEASSEGLTSILVYLRRNEGGKYRHLSGLLFEYMKRGPENIKRLDRSLGFFQKDIRDGVGEVTLNVAGTNRTTGSPTGITSPQEMFCITVLEILEWQNENPTWPVLDLFIDFQLEGRKSKLGRRLTKFRELLGIEEGTFGKWMNRILVTVLVATFLGFTSLMLAFIFKSSANLYGFFSFCGTAFFAVVALAFASVVALLFTAPGGGEPKNAFFKVLTAIVAFLLSIATAIFIMPDTMPASAVVVAALAGAGWITLLLRRKNTDPKVKMGWWGAILAVTVLVAIVWGIAPVSMRADFVAWFQPRFDEKTGGNNRQYIHDPADPSGTLVEFRDNKTMFDGNTGEMRMELTAQAQRARVQRFDRQTGQQYSKCFADPVSEEIVEVKDLTANFDIDSREPLHLCTQADYVALKRQNVEETKVVEKPPVVTPAPVKFTRVDLTPSMSRVSVDPIPAGECSKQAFASYGARMAGWDNTEGVANGPAWVVALDYPMQEIARWDEMPMPRDLANNSDKHRTKGKRHFYTVCAPASTGPDRLTGVMYAEFS